MKVARISINNYRSIQNLTFCPSNHNIFIGQVNAGKSTLLNSLALVLDPDIGRRFQVVDEMDFYGMKLKDESGEPVPIDIEVTLSGCSSSEKDSFLDYWEPWDDKGKTLMQDADDISTLDNDQYEFAFRIAFKASYDVDDDEIKWLWYYPKFSFLDGGAEYQSCPRKDREKAGFFYIPAERDVRKALSFSRHSALDKTLRADDIRLEGKFRDIIDDIKGKGDHLFKDENFSKLISELEDQIGNLLPINSKIDRRISFEMSGLGQYGIMNILRAFIALDGQDMAYPISSQGTGAKQILVLAALQMLSKRRQSSILAVEEPEMGLHPHMQRALADDLLKSTSQTFITTHSSQVAQTAGQENIFCFVKKYGEKLQIRPVFPSSDYRNSPETIRAVIQLNGHHPSDVLDTLFAPSVLLVEGVGDRQALPIMVRSLSHINGETKKDLDGLGIGVVPCTSKANIHKIAPYFKGQLGKRVYSLVDNEKSTELDNPKIIESCDCTFIWPKGCAIEKILLMNAREATIDRVVRYTTELGDTYFNHANSNRKNIEEKREDVFKFLKKRKSGHRNFAELLPAGEIAEPVKQLFDYLNDFVKSNKIQNEVTLGD